MSTADQARQSGRADEQAGLRVTVLGGCGAWPEAGAACSGFLVEHRGYRLLVDLGYGTFPRLQTLITPDQVDAVFISHGHPDHCVDLNPLLRARAMGGTPVPPVPIFAPVGALDAVLALDRPGMLDQAYRLQHVSDGDRFAIGPFDCRTSLLPHWLPNLGIRLTAGDRVIAYTGDSGPSARIPVLAAAADLLIADATFPDQGPADDREFLTSARRAAAQATEAGARRLLLTHLWPGTDPVAAVSAAAEQFAGRIDVAVGGLVVELTGSGQPAGASKC